MARKISEYQKSILRAYHFKHGEAPSRDGKQPTREYRAWRAMIDRCERKKDKPYKNYGGRGIKVCEKWRHDYLAFLADMGRCPKGMTLDRFPNNDGNYEPGNCRWATRKEQIANARKRKRRTHCKRGHELTANNTYIAKNGKRRCKICLCEWMREWMKRRNKIDTKKT